MRHRKKNKGTTKGQRQVKHLKRLQAESLFQHGYIQTTLPKAKQLRPYAEKLITKAIKANKAYTLDERLNCIRQISKKIRHQKSYSLLIHVWGQHCRYRRGGYLRIIKTGFRKGDGAEMALIGIVYDEIIIEKYKIRPICVKRRFKVLSNMLLMDKFIPNSQLYEMYKKKYYEIRAIKNQESEFQYRIQFVITRNEGEELPLICGQSLLYPINIAINIKQDYTDSIKISPINSLKEIPIYREKNLARFSLDQNSNEQSFEIIFDSKKLKKHSRTRRSKSNYTKVLQVIKDVSMQIDGPSGTLYSEYLRQSNQA